MARRKKKPVSRNRPAAMLFLLGAAGSAFIAVSLVIAFVPDYFRNSSFGWALLETSVSVCVLAAAPILLFRQFRKRWNGASQQAKTLAARQKKTATTPARMNREDAIVEFMMAHTVEVKPLENRVITLRNQARSEPDIQKRLTLLNECRESLGEIMRFCAAHGQGGRAYYKDNWEGLFNSQRSKFTYFDVVTEEIEECRALISKGGIK